MFTDGLDDDLERLKETSELLRGKGKCMELTCVGITPLTGAEIHFQVSKWHWMLLSLRHANPSDKSSVPPGMIPRLPLYELGLFRAERPPGSLIPDTDQEPL